MQAARAAIVVTHDRVFLDRVCTRIVELDRGLLRSYPGNFAAYYEPQGIASSPPKRRRARKFDQFWRQEEAWIRKGVEARRTRDEGRVRRLEALRSERALRRERLGSVKLALDAGERSGRLVAELDRRDQALRRRATSCAISTCASCAATGWRCSGRNGAGKSTLLKIILGQLAPDSGTVRLGTKLDVAYFDQLREVARRAATLDETISPGSDWIETANGRKHVLSYLGDFLFPPQRANAPVKTLSGGERNRLAARAAVRPARQSAGAGRADERSRYRVARTARSDAAVVCGHAARRQPRPRISRQRRDADARGRGRRPWREYVGGYSDWLAQRPVARVEPPVAAKPVGAPRARAASRVRLTFNEKRELDALPAELESLEREQHALSERMCAADYHRQDVEVDQG